MIHELLPALPQLQQRVASLCSGRDSKVLLAGSDGFEGDAVVAAVAIKMHEERQSCYEALTGLLHRNAALLVRPLMKVREEQQVEVSIPDHQFCA